MYATSYGQIGKTSKQDMVRLCCKQVIWVLAGTATLLCWACSSTGRADGSPAIKDRIEPAPIKTVVLGKSKAKGVPAPAMPGKNVPAIKVNTVGYPSSWNKIAIFNVEPKGAVVEDEKGKLVLKIGSQHIEARGTDKASLDPVWQVDFSALTKAGRYRLVSEGAKSDLFVIGDDIYQDAMLAGLKSFYFQRTRMPLLSPYAEWNGSAYTRPKASHVHEDVGWDLLDYPAKKRKWKVEGGWHDAGNYDMYIPSTGPSAQALLMAYQWAPELFDDKSLRNPESGNKIPDILDEVRWGLIWILSIQEKNGAFRHREAVMKWSPEKPADEDRTVRWIAGVSTSATAKAVAVLALASTIYAPIDPKFAARAKSAAARGWAFLLKTPEHIRVGGPKSPQPKWDDEPGNNDKGARFIAATEMWINLREKTALRRISESLETKEAKVGPGLINGAWANLSRWALIRLAQDKKTSNAFRKEARTRIIQAAELMHEQIEKTDGYRCASKPSDYYWAHNSNLMEKTHILAAAARLAPKRTWLVEAARDQWHWILGRNPNGYSMVTQVGKGPTRMYHMEWGNHATPPPGFLIGGPNASEMGFLAPGAPAKALLWENPKALRSGVAAGSMWHAKQSDLWDGGFVADGKWTEGWWAVTEPDIYYSANFVLAAATMPK